MSFTPGSEILTHNVRPLAEGAPLCKHLPDLCWLSVTGTLHMTGQSLGAFACQHH